MSATRLEHIARGGEPQASLSSVLCFGLRGGYVLRLCTRELLVSRPKFCTTHGRAGAVRQSDGLARLLTEAGLLVPLTAFSRCQGRDFTARRPALPEFMILLQGVASQEQAGMDMD